LGVYKKGKYRSAAPSTGLEEAEKVSFEKDEGFGEVADFTTVSEYPINFEYSINLPYNVVSNGKSRIVEVQKYELDAKYQYYAAPKLDPDAFLMARVSGWEKYNFLEHFDKLILSHEVGAIKPEEKIYRAVEEFTNEPSEKHIFIDDIAEYVEGAKKLGWKGIQFKSHEQLTEDLKLYDIVIDKN